MLAKGAKAGSLYPLVVSGSSVDHVLAVGSIPHVSLWHARLGHMSLKGMKMLSGLQYLPLLDYACFDSCDHCLYGKQNRSTHKKSGRPRMSEPLALVHSDVCGPMPCMSMGGAKYFVTFIDDFSRKVWAYPIKLKSDVSAVFQRWLALVENQTGYRLKCLRTDNGGEYVSHAFEQFCDDRGIKRQLTAPYTPPQNGLAERMNRTIQERVRSMLSHAGLPQSFWAEAVSTAVHVIN